MNAMRDLDLINELLALPAETTWLEFKGSNTDPEMIGKRCSALSNAARIEGRNYAYLVWGIQDETHAILGTDFNPDTKKSADKFCLYGWPIVWSQALLSVFAPYRIPKGDLCFWKFRQQPGRQLRLTVSPIFVLAAQRQSCPTTRSATSN